RISGYFVPSPVYVVVDALIVHRQCDLVGIAGPQNPFTPGCPITRLIGILAVIKILSIAVELIGYVNSEICREPVRNPACDVVVGDNGIVIAITDRRFTTEL